MARRNLLIPAAIAAALAHAALSHSQDIPQAGNNGSTQEAAAEGALQEVVVTAQKRAENLQKTAVAVAVTTNDDLVRAGAQQLADIQKVIPDIKLDRQGSQGFTVSIRGVYSTDNSPTAESANAVHLNGAYLAKTSALQGMLYDLERIEVAKGPQGTLYGRNANGGAINIISRKPTLDGDDGYGEFEFGSYNTLRETGAANISLGDTFAVRIAGQQYKHAGFYKSGLGDADEKGGRVSFLWQPTDNDRVTLIGDMEQIGGRGAGTNVVGNYPLKPTPRPYVIPGDPWDDRFYTVDTDSGKNEVQSIAQTNNGITAQYDRTLPFATWTTEAAWRKFDSVNIPVGSFGSADAGTPSSAEYLKANHGYNPQHFTSESVESRLTSLDSTPLQWVAGLYYFHDKDGGTNRSYGTMRSTLRTTEIANGLEIAKSYAAFGQATWTPEALSSLHLTAGARYTADQKDASGIFTFLGGRTTPVPPGSKSWSATTYKAGVAYDLTDSNLVYANYSTGYKAGGFAYGPGTGTSGVPLYAPEKIKAYEVGSKNRFFDNRLQVNLEAYYYKYRDFQTNLTLFPDPPVPNQPVLPILTVASAGQASYKGGAIDVQYAITDSDLFKVDYAVNRASYGTYIINAPPGFTINASTIPASATSPLIQGPSLVDLGGTDITNVPRYSGTTSFTHTFRMTRGSLDAQVAANFRGAVKFAIVADGANGVASPTAAQPTRALVTFEDGGFANFDFSLRYASESDKFAVTAYVHNIANRVEPNQGAYSASTALFTESFYPPRIFGAVFSVKFKGN